MNRIVTSTSEDQTYQLGKEIAQHLHGGDVVCLYGELGAGKTTFVKGLSEGLGIKSRIISPTFVVVRTHAIDNKSGIEKIYHLDLYRLESEKDVEGIGFSEIVSEQGTVAIIEWPEKAGRLLPKNRIDIRFEYINDHSRQIIITKINE